MGLSNTASRALGLTLNRAASHVASLLNGTIHDPSSMSLCHEVPQESKAYLSVITKDFLFQLSPAELSEHGIRLSSFDRGVHESVTVEFHLDEGFSVGDEKVLEYRIVQSCLAEQVNLIERNKVSCGDQTGFIKTKVVSARTRQEEDVVC